MPLTPLLPGDPKALGPHRLLGRLGRGGMGTVYLGVAPDERAVAVKVLREGPSDAEGRRRFRRELAALQRVRGEHLVEVLGGDVDADTPWIVTRFVPGRRLDEQVAEEGPLRGGALDRVAHGIADGLASLHAAGVVHRDLSPGNVLLVDGEPYVIDLGLAVVADVTAHTRSGLVLGTAGYLAPEQVLGTGSTEAVDVHAWGATVAYAGTGRPPYGVGRPEAVLYRVVHDPADLDGLPAPLVDLVRAALAKDPQQRPAMADLLAELELAPDRDLVGVTSGPQVVPAGLTASERGGAVVLPPDTTMTTLLPDVPAARPDPTTDRLRTSALPGVPPDPDAPATTVLRLDDVSRPPAGPDAAATTVLRLDDLSARAVSAATGPAETAVLPPARGDDGSTPMPPPDPTHRLATPDPTHRLATPDPTPAAPAVQAGADPELPPGPRRVHGAVVGVPTLLVVFAAGCLAPFAVALAVLVGLVVLSAVAGSETRVRERRERRGPRASDGVVGLLALPAHLLAAAAGTLLGLPLVLLGATAAWLVARLLLEPSLTSPALTSVSLGTAVTAGTLVAASRRRAHRLRQMLMRGTAWLAPTPGALAVLVGVLLCTAAALALAGTSVQTTLWPLPPAALDGLAGRLLF